MINFWCNRAYVINIGLRNTMFFIKASGYIPYNIYIYYGHHGTKQFIRGKPICWGYKLWTATTPLLYIEWFEPYQGSTTILSQKYKDLGLGASVVLQCADTLQANQPNLAYLLYFDNFFTSPKLLDELREKGIKGTGTIRENRLGK